MLPSNEPSLQTITKNTFVEVVDDVSIGRGLRRTASDSDVSRASGSSSGTHLLNSIWCPLSSSPGSTPVSCTSASTPASAGQSGRHTRQSGSSHHSHHSGRSGQNGTAHFKKQVFERRSQYSQFITDFAQPGAGTSSSSTCNLSGSLTNGSGSTNTTFTDNMFDVFSRSIAPPGASPSTWKPTTENLDEHRQQKAPAESGKALDAGLSKAGSQPASRSPQDLSQAERALVEAIAKENGCPTEEVESLACDNLLQQIPRNENGEILSVGSIPHNSETTCIPCVFWFKGTCRGGLRCNFCHFAHKEKRSKPSKRTRQRLRRIYNDGLRAEEQEDDDAEDEADLDPHEPPDLNDAHLYKPGTIISL